MSKKASEPTLEEVMEVTNLNKKIANLQDELKDLKIALYEKYGDVSIVYQLDKATVEGHTYARVDIGKELTPKYEAKITFLKKDPTTK